jgi:Mg-chelatase subunit ChlD
MFTLGGEVQRLEEIKHKNLQRGRGLGLLSLLVALAILFILYQVYSRTVLAYAVLENIKFEQDPIAENQLTISFDVKKPGKVAFDRRSGKGHTEKIDLIATTEGHKTVWAWPSDPKTGIDLSVLYRSGLFRTSTDRHFDVTRDGIGVEVVFLMDITSSMGPYIEALKRDCIDFAEQVRREKLDCRLGLIGFGDVNYNEPIVVFDPTADVKEFQANVSRLELTNGGDPDESSVEAIEKALEMEFRPHTRICFIHITDASCHNRNRIPELVSALKEKSIVTYVISQKGLRNVYRPLCVNGGAFFGIRDAPFGAILKDVARSMVNAIKSD